MPVGSSRAAGRGQRVAFLPEGARDFLLRRTIEIVGVALIGIGAALSLALVSYHPGDPSWNTATGDGPVRAAIVLAAVAIAPLPAPDAWSGQASLGGAMGAILLGRAADALMMTVGQVEHGTIAAVAGVLALAALATALGLSGAEWRQGAAAVAHAIAAGAGAAWRLTRHATRSAISLARRLSAGSPPASRRRQGVRTAPSLRGRLAAPGDADEEGVQDDADEEEEADGEDESAARPRPPAIIAPKRLAPAPRRSDERQRVLDFDAEPDYELPPLDLLRAPDPAKRPAALNEDALRRNAEILVGVLADFGVRGEVVRVNPGPVVTLYELEPAPGTKSSRVIGLADDIARSMSAVSVRVAVVPGRNVIGIELPNAHREIVLLRELLSAVGQERTPAKLGLSLGKDIGGTPIIVDLARMPHLLVAGTTGSGKSVAINTMILSLLYRQPPERVRFILVDPKMLELSVYDGIPHLLAPVVTEPKKAVVALKWAVREMEDRYRAMSKLGVRNIEGYNQRLREAQAKGETLLRRVQTGFDPDTGKPVFEDQPLDLTELPYIVVVVDEMADLMLVAGKDIEAAIQRLAQMARAAGIHLIMATQRPSVDVITGTIKANFPTRISFQVTSRIDSRTILGESGAEQLLGQGDMLYMAGGGRITRVHGPFVSDEEVEAVVRHLKAQGEPAYNEAILEDDEEDDGEDFGEAGDGGEGSGDDLYDQAVAVVIRERKASTSFIQRHLQIGYNRAARLIERMEQEGVVSQANRVGKREVLVHNAGERVR
jgi:S-DNA-T family DNA segregation ATPase FtsK/SpoIIIE